MSESKGATPLYIPTLPSIPAAFSELLKNYSHISPADQHDHILQLRERAYKHHPYPCLGRWRFLDLDLSVHPQYKAVLEILSSDLKESTTASTTFLDLGCCLGQDVRKLFSDLLALNQSSDQSIATNIAKKLFGADLRPEFIQIGYELFADDGILPKGQFIAPADVFDTSPTSSLAALDGKISVLNCTAVFHLFDWDDQVRLAHRCLRLLGRSGIQGKIGKKALLLGAQTSNLTASEYPRQSGGMRYRHNEESWRKLWNEVVTTEEWVNVVKSVEVASELQMPSAERLALDGTTEKVNVGKAGKVVGSMDETPRSWMIGQVEDGFRWQVWWVWVEFN